MMKNDQWGLNRHPPIAGQSSQTTFPSLPSDQQVEEISATIRYAKQKPKNDIIGREQYSGPIPRIRSRMRGDTQTLQKGRNFDTFGENALETIYDEFRFLDEPEAPSPSSTSRLNVFSEIPTQQIPQQSEDEKHHTKSDRKMSLRYLAFALLALIQLACAITFFVLAYLRTYQFSIDENWETGDSEFLELDQSLVIKREGIDLVRFKSALSLYIPALLQFLSAIFSFWPFVGRYRTSFQVLHITFSLISIIVWFSAVEVVCYELNSNYSQLDSTNTAKSNFYILCLVLLGLGFFATIILPSLTLVFTCRLLVPSRRHSKNLANTVLAVGTALISATALFFAAFSTSRSLHLTSTQSSLMYGIGLREVIISTHVVFCSLLYFFASLYRDLGLSISSSLLQMTNIISLGCYIFNSTRLLSVIYDIILLSKSKIQPNNLQIAYPSILLLYTFLFVLLLLLIAQLVMTVISINDILRNDDHRRLLHSSQLTTTTNTNCSQIRTTF
ncbi:unnamed protein product [Auanema sp. JU1783]|nr:unnamed protein product [Auanema sp. JU1783]